MKQRSRELLIIVLLLIFASVFTMFSVKSLNLGKSSESMNYSGQDFTSYNNLVVTGTPINNGEFISGGGIYRDINLKLRINIPVGWSIGLSGSGCTCQYEYEDEPSLRITSNSQPLPKGLLGSEDLIEAVSITRAKYSSFEVAVAQFSEIDSNIVALTKKPLLLAGKYTAEEINIEYSRSEGGTESPMRLRTYLLVEHGDYIYSIDTVNTDFYNSDKVQKMLNSIEFYE